MNYQELIRSKRDKKIKTLVEHAPHTIVMGVRYLTECDDQLSPHVLYVFAAYSDMLNSLSQSDLSILLCGKINSDAIDLDHFANVYQIEEKTSPYEVRQMFLSVLRDEQLYLRVSEQLTSALISNNGLQYLLDEAQRILGNPLLLVDSAYRYIAVSVGDLRSDSQFAQKLNEELEHGFVLEEGVQYIKQIGLDKITRGRSEPYFMDNEILGSRMYVSSVRVHNVDVAHLTLVEHVRPLTELDKRCMKKLVGLIAQEMQKNEFYATNRGQMYSYLLKDIMDSEQPSYENIKRRMDVLNFKLGDAFYIVVIHGRKFEEPTFGLEYVTEQLAPILTGNMYARYQSSLVLFINLKDRMEISDFILEKLHEIAIKSRHSIGISNVFHDLADVRQKYTQAMRASIFGELSGDQNTLYYYKDYAVQDLLDIGKRQRNLLELCHPNIFKLMEYDRKNNAQLTHTLYYYLEIPHTPQRIADKLHIHRNTFFYRLERIRDILQSDLKNGRELFLLHFSFVVLHFLGKFDPNPFD